MSTSDGAHFSLSNKRVWVAGDRGMVGAALMRRLKSENCELITVSRKQVDLRRQDETASWIEDHRPDVIFVAAARVGGIRANSTYPVDFLFDNLMIEANIINSAHHIGVDKLMFLGSSCIYPKHAAQPICEDALLTGPLEPTNEWYAVAKIAGIKLCQAYRRQYGDDFISVMPTNLYGPGDNFHPVDSHVPASLIRRFHEAKLSGAREVQVWGTGAPLREFLYVDDLADACVWLMKFYSGEEHVNVGVGKDLSIADFAVLVKDVVGYTGNIAFDASKPDGAPRKLLDVSRLRDLGWQAKTPLRAGLTKTYEWFLQHPVVLDTRVAAVG